MGDTLELFRPLCNGCKCPAKYILPLPRRNSGDAFQSSKRGAA